MAEQNMVEQNMVEKNKDQHLDEMLDSLLASYSTAEPRPGMETRILASVRERQKFRRLGFTWLWASAGTAAAVLIVIALLFNHSATLPKPPVTAGTISAPHIDSTTAPSNVTMHAPRKTPAPPVQERAVEADVRQEVFPTPVPMSDQERLLLQYLRATPRAEVIAQSHMDPPPEITDDDQSFKPVSKPGTQQFSTTR
jgi:hypothetical protein